MSGSLNKAELIGHLGSDPDLKYLPSGNAVVNFSIATTEKWTNKSGALEEHTEWHKIVAYGKLAEVCGKYLKKGSQVYVGGKIQTRSWEDKDKNKRNVTEIIIWKMLMLDSKTQQEGGKDEPRDEDIPF